MDFNISHNDKLALYTSLPSIRPVRRMRWTIILRHNMINMLAKSNRFATAASIAACTAATATSFASWTMSYAVRFLWSFTVKSL